MDPRLHLIRCDNPGPWTGTGTNSWLIEGKDLVLIDPGPESEAHRRALVEAIGGRRLAAILVTHAHRDHSSLAPRLARDFDAPILAAADPHGEGASRVDALGLPPGEGVDRDFRPDRAITDGEVLELGGLSFVAHATPGHLGGHFCFALGDLLFSGDHVMGWSTSVVTPPEGDMAAYRASLARLALRPWRRMLPGHGPAIEEPGARLAELIAHRARRAAEVRAALERGPASPLDLVATIYPDLQPALVQAAAGNVLAHLVELAAEGRATPPGAGLSLAEPWSPA